MSDAVFVGCGALSIGDVVAVARDSVRVEIAPPALEAIAASREHVERVACSGEPRYGVSTGFGALAVRYIEPDKRRTLQRALVRSHAAGAGPFVETEVVRALMLLRLATLCTGHTGVRVETAQAYAAILNAGITPCVPEHGSLGCSGDLAPLAHCAMTLIGEGEAIDLAGRRMPSIDALRAAGLEPIELQEKEGLALINGTDGMLGMLCLAITDMRMMAKVADVSAAMSLEALLGTDRVLSPEIMALRPHPGQATAARNMLRLLKGSSIVASHREGDARVQDAYSLRCAPQVAGAVRDTLAHAESVARRELAAAIDNPVVLPDGSIESNGNFHGAPLGYVLDFLGIVAADLASMAERRTDRMLDTSRSNGLPAFLAHDPGVDSGHMIAHYTQAGIVSEMKRLAVPASVDSIPSSAMQEDHVSMGWGAARKLRRSLEELRIVLAIELLTAARAIDLRAPLEPAAGTGAVRTLLREHVEGCGPDRQVSPEIDVAVGLVEDGAVVAAAQHAIGELE